MVEVKPKVLFICFYFPPFNRVGGRRWAKHIKYLQKHGEEFHVLAGDYDSISQWDKDIESYKDKITRVPVTIYYPYFKRVLAENIFQKIKWKCSLLYNNYLEKKYKGNFWDDSRGYEKQFYAKAVEIINRLNINTVCLSVGPFSYAVILNHLKKKFPLLKIGIDVRDYWCDPHFLLQNQYEINKEKIVFSAVDFVFVVNNEMEKFYSEKFHKPTFTLPHCFDQDDYLELPTSIKNQISTTALTFIYGGALYADMQNEIDTFLWFIDKLKTNTKIEIYSHDVAYQDKLKSFEENEISVYKPVSQKIYFEKLNNVKFILVFRPHWTPNAFSTKFYELLYFRKPLLYFGPTGDVSNFIIKNKLGLHITEEFISIYQNRLVETLTAIEINKNFDLSKYDFDFWSKELMNQLNLLYEKKQN